MTRRLRTPALSRREALIGLVGVLLLLLALLSVFAIELADTQAKSKQDVKARVHERGVLAAALIDSLFGTVAQQIPQDQRLYGGRVVTTQTMDRQRQQNLYLVLLDPSGRVMAHSHGFTAQVRSELPDSAALALVRAGHTYALGNLRPYGRTGVMNLAVAFPTQFGPRILLTGFALRTLSGFLTNDLEKVPGVKGAHNYLLDAKNVVLGSTNSSIPVGKMLNSTTQRSALARTSGDVNGHYYDQVPISNSTWRVVLSAPNGPLFAQVSGLRQWLPWVIFAAFALVAGAALALAVGVVRGAQKLRTANRSLEDINRQVEAANQVLDVRARELARSNEELEQFASIASHDLKEPLRKVRTFTQALGSSEADSLSEKGRDYIERANRAVGRMEQLIDGLLKYSRVSTHGRPFVPVDMNELTRGVLDDLELEVAGNAGLVQVGELPTVNADPIQMRQLMQNLISNAVKFRRPGVPPEIRIDGDATNGRARIVVSDNGIGFEPEYKTRIFRVFERLHGRGRYPGTGIGLALCLKIAERHGGTVTADARPDAGASFTVTLPLERRREPTSVDGNGSPPAEETHRVRV